MNKQEYLLTKLAEECAEVAQRCTKALTFGLHEKQPGQEHTNLFRMMDEIEDFLIITELMATSPEFQLQAWERGTDRISLEEKQAKVEKYMQYSRDLGILFDDKSL